MNGCRPDVDGLPATSGALAAAAPAAPVFVGFALLRARGEADGK